MAKPKKPDPASDAKAQTDKASDSKKDPVASKPSTVPKAKEAPKKPDVPETGKDTSVSPPAAPEPAKKQGGFGPALVGGILAAALGFFAARTEVLDPVLPGFLKSEDLSGPVAALADADAQQKSSIAALKAEIDAIDRPDMAAVNAQIESVAGDIASLSARIEAHQTMLSDIESQLAPLATRLDNVEKRPMTEAASQEAIAAYDRELAALRDAVAAQRADAEKMIEEARANEAAARALEENAASAARDARIQAIVTRLRGTINGGGAYVDILAELTATGVAVPEALNASANSGVTTLASLSESFPTAARAALSAARSETGDSGGLGGFLQRQLGARSVEPRGGDDPDAILSRAEAAVTGGDLDQAIAEIATLPETARTAMQAWVDIATVRLTALKAADDLSQSLNTN